MVPHGDRVHGAKSRRIEHEVRTVGCSKKDIVCVFVLNYDVIRHEAWTLPHGPLEDFIEGAKTLNLD
jgi:hypothetical protein